MNKGLNVGILLFSLGILVMLSLVYENVRLMIVGVKTKGTVYQLNTKDNPAIRMPGVRYDMPVISFFTPTNERFETWGCPDCYSIGDKVPVIYDPRNPSNAEVDSLRLYEPLYYLAGLIGFLLFFIRIKIKSAAAVTKNSARNISSINTS